MPHKEHYRHALPHFQQPGQAYFITWSLKDAVPPKALKRYMQKLEMLKSQLDASGAADSNPPYYKSPIGIGDTHGCSESGATDSNTPLKCVADSYPPLESCG